MFMVKQFCAMQPETNVPFYRGETFQNATEFGNKSINSQSFCTQRVAFGRFLTSYEWILKVIFATLHRQRTNNEKSASICHFPRVRPRRMGAEYPYPFPEFQH
jgi:hypothetical protein